MSLSHNEAVVEGITDVLHTFNRETDEIDPDIVMAGVLEVLNDFLYFGVPVITTQVIMNEGDWVTVKNFGEHD